MLRKIKILALCLVLFGCQNPFLVFPGKSLSGEERIVESFAFAADYPLLQLETRLEQPYSVLLRTTVIDGELYVDAAPARRWGKYLAESSQVRIKLGEAVYPAMAEVVTDPDITDRFLSGRTIYRIKPRRSDSSP